MSKIKEAEKIVKIMLSQLSEAQSDLIKVAGECTIQCLLCKKRSKVKSITIIQTHWYMPPSGCTGGAYWNAGELEFDCPKCGKHNRKNDRFKEFSTKYRQAFAGKIDTF